ncbi:hypothetical protein SAMN05443633_10573 [Chryseobacterium arachidis]|uniref:Lipoprotein n=1 Tax=Chryseobacterium arachidis TaxID=1416778 RepID=A0A1M5CVZ6_9FLAO|nr:hypothetical protein [Chryseobacterium arachidis]SHF58934.1 hypothetical protein SAMN05443633_10573 [Chryseobacterium arachidis]
MELVKKIFYGVSILLLFSCNGQENKAELQGKTTLSYSQNENSEFILQKQISKDENNFKYLYKENIFQLVQAENFTYDLSIDHNIYDTNLVLESASINIWNFKRTNDHIILVEGDDYYGSVFYIFYYNNNTLKYYDSIYYEVKNAEKNKEEKKFEVNFKNQTLAISISQNENKNNYELKRYKTVQLLNDRKNNLLKESNGEIIQEKNADINQDGIQDKIQIIQNKGNEYYSIIIAISNKNSNNKIIFKNEKLLTPPNSNSTGIGLKKIVTKNNYITFEDNITEGNPTKNEYTTFIYDAKEEQLYLHKYGITAMFDDDNSSKDWEKINTKKDFGTIQFENVDKEFLRNLLSK